MRRACMSGPQWFSFGGDESKVEGVALGSDACAEHEWGTKDIRLAFGLDQTKDGVERRQIRNIPEGLALIDKKGLTAIFYTRKDYRDTPAEERAEGWLKDSELHYDEKYDKNPLVAAWDETSFGIVAHGKTDSVDRVRMRELWEAFQKKDVAFWTNIGVFHMGGGLIFAIVSRLREEDKASLLECDLDEKRLNQCAEATGIEEVLKKAGRHWFSLSPRWSRSLKSTKNGEIKTQFEVLFWLNPCDQDKNNYGYFTVEELQQWAKGEGPIPMTKGK